MKEFLVNHDGKWTLQLLDSDTEENSYRVAVPSGAECLTKCDNHKAFWMNGAVKFIGVGKDWDFNYGLTVSDYLDVCGDNAEIVWKRSEIESLNDQYAEIEKVRRKTYGFTPERAARISLKTRGSYLDISDTLKQRESTYGSFEDVACVTQDLLSVLKRTGFDSLPKPHKEALHMICSKVARLVNGDFKHLDGWHDIGGYAKLIEDMIEKEMKNEDE